MNILFILSGSIACYKACDAISQLVQRGHTVRTVATEAALKFVGTATLEGLTREKVATDLFASGEALDHINLSRWADLTVVCPATANTLNRMAAGLGDDLAGALLLAHDWKKPLLLAPAMNPMMWSHPATTASVLRLQQWGARFIRPGEGRTACGEVGEGRLAEPDEIVSAIEAALRPAGRRLRILITSGGTSEPIDGVRVISNTSTGATGALIADQLARDGHRVVLLRAASAAPSQGPVEQETFVSFADLDAALERRLRNESFDAVIHAAAVSDFSVDRIEADGKSWSPGSGKIPSGATPTIKLRRNPKLLDTLRARSKNSAIRIVAFKLTRDADEPTARAAIDSLFAAGAADFVVHNDLSQRAANGAFPADIWSCGRDVLTPRVAASVSEPMASTRGVGAPRLQGPELVAHCPDRPAIGPALEKLLTPEFFLRHASLSRHR